MQSDPSPLELQVADVLRRARRLPIGAGRNDLHQLAVGLLLLRRRGMDALIEGRRASMSTDGEFGVALDHAGR
jgi:hypothetical protein